MPATVGNKAIYVKKTTKKAGGVRSEKSATLKKHEVLDLGSQVAENGGHSMSKYRKNGKGLMLSKCKECGAMTIAKKKFRDGWTLFGTAQTYTCERMQTN